MLRLSASLSRFSTSFSDVPHPYLVKTSFKHTELPRVVPHLGVVILGSVNLDVVGPVLPHSTDLALPNLRVHSDVDETLLSGFRNIATSRK